MRRQKSIKNKPVTKSADEDQWIHWWKNSPIFELPPGEPERSQIGAEFWYDHFWKPKRISAWAYELVRRLTKLKDLKDIKLDNDDLKALAEMPPYSKLLFEQKEMLRIVFHFNVHPGPPHVLRKLELESFKNAWRDGQPHKLGLWHFVEVLDKNYSLERKEQRKASIKYIKRYWPLIEFSWRAMKLSEELIWPLAFVAKPHYLSGSSLTKEQFSKILTNSNSI